MKLCPQCEFIYEDDQSCCDMDGTELVQQQSRSPWFEENVAPDYPTPFEPASVPASLTAEFPASQSRRWHAPSSAFTAVVAVLLAVLLVVVYYARTHQAQSDNPNQALRQDSIQSSNHTDETLPVGKEQAADTAAAPPESLPASPESSSDSSKEPNDSSTPLSSSSMASLNRGRMINPVVARESALDQGSVIIRLTDGSSIRADEAWEKREGVWYRQAGMVTFLKRSRVRGIQRLGSPAPRSKSVATTAVEKSHRPDNNAIAQNHPRVEKPEVGTPKKESKVTMFLKRTGQILKKPFKF